MLKYRLYQNKNKKSTGYGKWYARATVNETYDLTRLAEHMANHNTPYSQGAIYGVLTDMVACIHELVLEGNAVKIPDLAIFSLGLNSKGSDSHEQFSAAEDIISARLRARATGSLMTTRVSSEARIRQYTPYSIGTASEQTGE
jgi:predicted histone-like DNA-binding protein